MAQVTGGSDFDFPWNDKAIACLTVLREAADAWARNGIAAIAPTRVVAMLLRVVGRRVRDQAAPWSRPSWPVRFIPEWLDTTTDSEEIPITLRSGKSAPVDSRTLAALDRLLEHSAQLWSLGNPEEPAPRDVLDGVHQILWRGRFAPRPPSRLPFEDPWN